MIPSILTESGTTSSKAAPTKETNVEGSEGDLFGDLVTGPTDAPIADVDSIDPHELKAVLMGQDAEMFSEGQGQEPATLSDEDATIEADDRQVSPDLAAEQLPSALVKTDQTSNSDLSRVKRVLEPEVLRSKDPSQSVKIANSEGQKAFVQADRPSVAQTVVEGRLPQQKILENLATKDRAEKTEDAAKPPLRAEPATHLKTESNQLIKAVATDAKPAQSPSPERFEQRKDVPREATSATIQKVETAKPIQSPPPAVMLAQVVMPSLSEKVEKTVKVAISEVAMGGAVTERVATTQVTQTSATSSATPETARQVANQIAIAITNTTSKTTEIALNPEELGRVRLSLSAADGAITLNVLAERAETQDLLRRHIDQLAQEFRALGYKSIAFSFGDQNAQSHAKAQQPEDSGEPEIQDVATTTDFLPKNATAGLDLRV